MNIEEAIYELNDLEAENIELGRDRAAKAERLGIEALKAWKEVRYMTLEDAIAITQVILDVSDSWAESEEKEALKLGIEALKREQKWRADHRDLGFLLLPGETEESSET